MLRPATLPPSKPRMNGMDINEYFDGAPGRGLAVSAAGLAAEGIGFRPWAAMMQTGQQTVQEGQQLVQQDDYQHDTAGRES
jgi:hypothetical protein